MGRQSLSLALAGMALMATACHTPYTMTGISRSRIVVDGRYDAHPDARAAEFIKPYSRQVDSLMSPVVGSVARYMAKARPESELSNLLSDILLRSGGRYGERPDLAVYNMGGIRAGLAQGKVTVGNILDVAPFENKICFLTLTGADLMELFAQIARRGGEGVSRGVELRIGQDGRLLEARLGGRAIDPAADYRVATLDYLAQGNDGLKAFKKGTGMNMPGGSRDNVRELIKQYFLAQTAAGNVVDSRVEGRIKIEKQ